MLKREWMKWTAALVLGLAGSIPAMANETPATLAGVKVVTAEEAKTHPQRNLVFSCLGGDMTPRIDISPAVALEAGDTLALCSDGAWAPLAERLSKGFGLPLERAVPFLLDEAEAAAGPGCDNLSLIALRWESSAGSPQSDDATRPFSVISTIVQNFAAEVRNTVLSDADIDRAVTEIRGTIRST